MYKARVYELHCLKSIKGVVCVLSVCKVNDHYVQGIVHKVLGVHAIVSIKGVVCDYV